MNYRKVSSGDLYVWIVNNGNNAIDKLLVKTAVIYNKGIVAILETNIERLQDPRAWKKLA